ncbi:MAG: DUF1768 domain-containing protein [Alphaproteobacteria bacterium]|nr:DUF1768 domain-containing protein [Alphaproteobacteria bacterium]
MAVIHFYRTVDPFGCFSNFSAHPIFVEGKAWPTSEHYFQAQKFLTLEARQKIRSAGTPALAAQLGRSRNNRIRDDWEKVKDDIMRFAVRMKAAQHSDVREALQSTGDAAIVEHTKNDSYWADGGDGTGKNMLGLILMEIRSELAAGALGDLVSCVPAPPWIEHPQFAEPSDLGWRMGFGQDYMEEWIKWYSAMSKANRQRYLALFRMPTYWMDWLSRVN